MCITWMHGVSITLCFDWPHCEGPDRHSAQWQVPCIELLLIQAISLLSDWMTWMLLTSPPCVILLHSAVMRCGRALMFAQEPAPQLEPVFVHMLHGLHGHLTSMLGHC